MQARKGRRLAASPSGAISRASPLASAMRTTTGSARQSMQQALVDGQAGAQTERIVVETHEDRAHRRATTLPARKAPS